MGFCTVAEMAAFLQIAIDAGDVSALGAISEATAAIKNYCHQVLELVEDDTYIFDVPPRRTRLFLPELPVTEVSEVVEDDEVLTEDDDYQLGLNGKLHRVGAFWYAGIQTVEVVYSHGYATIPEDVAAVCKRAAGRAYQAGKRSAEADGVSGVAGMTLGDYSVTYGSEQSGGASGGGMLGSSAAPMLLPSEKRMLDAYRVVGA